jgi:glucokinase
VGVGRAYPAVVGSVAGLGPGVLVTTWILAGDVGGTKTDLALFRADGDGDVRLEREDTLPSREYPDLESLVRVFLSRGDARPSAAVFGIAGPVLNGEVRVTNLPWRVEAQQLGRELGIRNLRLLNDLEATAYGALFLEADKLHVLNEGVRRPGHRVVIAAGTGLGQAILFWDGRRFRPSATEGGHAAFAPRNEREIALLRFLQRRYEHVSWERVVSGPGLVHIFEYLDREEGIPVAPEVRERISSEDAGSVVGEAGRPGSCPACAQAVDLFVSLYGAQTANLALTVLSLGGVYVGGGIVTKLLPAVTKGAFLEAFRDAGRFGALLAEMPVEILLDPKAGRLGAARVALELVGEGRGAPVGAQPSR